MRRLAALLAALAAVHVSGACAKNIVDLAPVPCALDRTCPDGLACNPGVGCSAAKLDSPCVGARGEIPATDCAPAAPRAACALGMCVEPCDAQGRCDAGRICSGASAAGGGHCVRDCSAGQACPKGLACRDLGYEGRRGCIAGGQAIPLDGPCQKDADCAAAGKNVRCTLGVCAAPCGDGGACADGHVCSSPSGAGVCLLDCGATGSCAADLACHDLWFGSRRACMGAAATAPACKQVGVISACPSQGSICGTSLDLGPECPDACPPGTPPPCACPKGSACLGDSCSTDCSGPSAATSCDGAPCQGSACAGGQWWCAPQTVEIGCAADPSHWFAFCECVDGRTVQSPCGQSVPCERLCQNECDPVRQDCPASAAKCSHVVAADGITRTACVVETGDKDVDQPCSRVAGGVDESAGHDDCKPGLYCTAQYADGYRCKRFCVSNSDCPEPDTRCWEYGPMDSLCIPTCDRWTGQSCPAGTACKWPNVCMREGYGIEGDPCTTSTQCKDALSCQVGRCKRSCSDEHPCDDGHACDAYSTDPPHDGFCAP